MAENPGISSRHRAQEFNLSRPRLRPILTKDLSMLVRLKNSVYAGMKAFGPSAVDVGDI